MARSARQAMLAKVHIARKELCLTEADYKHVLSLNYGVESSALLSDRELNDLLSLFKSKGWKPKTKGRPAESPRDMKPPVRDELVPLIDKIEALLSEMGRLQGRRVSWAYGEAILRKQGGARFWNWATVAQLEKVIQALSYALKRLKAKKG